jgi:hypothetical protein
MNLPFNEEDLPEVVVESEATDKYPYTYVKVGKWSFCVEDDLEDGFSWEDAKSIIAYAKYLDKIKEEQANKTTVE